MPLQYDNTLLQNYYEWNSEMNDALQVAFYYYYYHSAMSDAIFGFSLVNLLTG